MMKTGHPDDVLAIFNGQQHNFIMVGEHAQRWMAVSALTEVPNALRLLQMPILLTKCVPQDCIDVLVRTSQLDDILTALLDSGKWEKSERDQICYFYDAAREAPVLKRVGVEKPYHLSLWTEIWYCLSVDERPENRGSRYLCVGISARTGGVSSRSREATVWTTIVN